MEKQKQGREVLKACGGTHKCKGHTQGLPSSPTNGTKMCSLAPLCFSNASAIFNPTPLLAALQLFCKYVYKPSSALWWVHGSSSLPQPGAAYISRSWELCRRVQLVGKKLSKCLSIAKQELRRVCTSPLLFTNSFLMLTIYPHLTFSSRSSNSSLPPTSCCSDDTRQTEQPVQGCLIRWWLEGNESEEAAKEQPKSLMDGKT